MTFEFMHDAVCKSSLKRPRHCVKLTWCETDLEHKLREINIVTGQFLSDFNSFFFPHENSAKEKNSAASVDEGGVFPGHQ